MSKKDIKAIIKDLKKNELTELISVAQEVLSTIFNSSEIREIMLKKVDFPRDMNVQNVNVKM